MWLTEVTAPTVEPLSVATLKHWANITTTVDDAKIEAAITSARAHLDGARGILGRALMTQVWKAHYPAFADCMEIPLPPCQSVDSIVYIDSDGDAQTLASSVYDVFFLSAAVRPAEVRIAYGQSWPSTRARPDAVSITFTAGYGSAAEAVPKPLVQAMQLLATHYYQEPSAVLVGPPNVNLLPLGVQTLIAPYRVGVF